MSDPDLEVFCIIIDEKKPFMVDIEKNRTVAALQKSIKAERCDRFQHTPAHLLDLHYVNIINDSNLVANVATQQLGPELRATDRLPNIFNGSPKKHTIHFIVQPPTVGGYFFNACMRLLAPLNLTIFFRPVTTTTTTFPNPPSQDSSSPTDTDTSPLLDDKQTQELVSQYERDLRAKLIEFLRTSPRTDFGGL
jgi:Crinkler effector protein N-terminal domain